MLKHIVLTAALLSVATPGAIAQNADQIASAKSGKSCETCNLFQADFSYRKITGVSFAGARLRQSNMTLAILDDVSFRGANLSIANMYGVRLTGASLKDADLTDAILVGGSFESTNFEGAVLKNTNISGAEMSRARGLTQGQLNEACGDASTVLPSGLNVQHCR